MKTFLSFFIVLLTGGTVLVGQEIPDLAALAARKVDAKSQSIVVKMGNKTLLTLVKEDSLFWKEKTEGYYVDTAYWMGFPPPEAHIVETAQWEARPFTPGNPVSKDEFSLFRALVGPNGEKRSQTLIFDNSGRILRAFWTPPINESAALDGSASVPIITDPQLSMFASSKPDSSIGVSQYVYDEKTNQLSQFVNQSRGYLWDFKYDRKGRLYMISGTEGKKRVSYKVYYR